MFYFCIILKSNVLENLERDFSSAEIGVDANVRFVVYRLNKIKTDKSTNFSGYGLCEYIVPQNDIFEEEHATLRKNFSTTGIFRVETFYYGI